MIPYIEGYRTYQLIQSNKNNTTQIESEIQTFISLGWDVLGILHIGEAYFTQLGWLSSKGNPIYPEVTQSY